MTALRITPRTRYGEHSLYVSLPDGRTVAWYDRESGRVSLLYDEYREAVLEALAPHSAGARLTVTEPAVPTAADLARLSLHPDDDLAPNRPGEALYEEAGRERQAAGRLARRVLGRPDPVRRAQEELGAQQRVGDELDAAEGAGWRVLHSVPLPGGTRIHHLLVGPGGVLTVRSEPMRGLRVRAEEDMVFPHRGDPRPCVRLARQEAERARHALAVDVRPVLVLVGATGLEAGAAAHDVRVLTDAGLPLLIALGGLLKPADVETVHARARNRHSWLRV
ncbi:nuclease-related domain-containing protein [Streptomyces sp. GC420]|uniref:nuclease-related domain-containing protein n=1 Tax=Streptomyces sp. GC420 TaxID=2697568 RepID=UPI001414EFBA|nr:nuclease-related domain-containing protein [Streptomyces sp. GC420]NBM17776.1 NERD domain-containing protein [Streptomyces sp. GC420]